jgi:hypothetical protein
VAEVRARGQFFTESVPALQFSNPISSLKRVLKPARTTARLRRVAVVASKSLCPNPIEDGFLRIVSGWNKKSLLPSF